MKKIFILFFLLAASYQLLATPVSAHVLATDGLIGAILHIDPDDDPIAGSQAGFFFEFKDKQNKFKPTDCDCVFNIYEADKLVFSSSLTATNPNPTLDNVSLFYTFPQKDVYKVQVIGKPLTPGEFQNFTLNYNVRVARGTDAQNSPLSSSSNNWFSVHFFHIFAAIALILVLIALLVIQSRRKRALQTKTPIK